MKTSYKIYCNIKKTLKKIDLKKINYILFQCPLQPNLTPLWCPKTQLLGTSKQKEMWLLGTLKQSDI